jgi:hypothetical protein
MQRSLFGRVAEKKEKPKRKKRKDYHANTVDLMTGTTPAQEAHVEQLKHELEHLCHSLWVTRNYDPNLCALDLEYYGDQRLWDYWWWLLFDLDESFDVDGESRWAEAPSAKDYDIGAYWRKYMDGADMSVNEDTVRYVNDRAKWAEKFILNEIKEAARCYANAYLEREKGRIKLVRDT